MSNLPANSTKPLSNNGFLSIKRNFRLFVGMLIVAPLGFLDAAYLTVEHYLNRVPPCSLITGCEVVTTSKYSVIMGVPMALMGALYYMVIILALIYYLDSRRAIVLKGVALFTIFGFVFSLYLVYLQLFVINAICIYCMGSALSSTILFILGQLMLRSNHEFENQVGKTPPDNLPA